MTLGPVEMLVVHFPENKAPTGVVPALREAIGNGTIRIIDILFIRKDQNGKLSKTEINDLEDASFAMYDPLITDLTGLMSEEDVQQLADSMPNNSSAGVMLYEKTWAKRFRDTVAEANGQIVYNERIPHTVIEQIITAQNTSASTAQTTQQATSSPTEKATPTYTPGQFSSTESSPSTYSTREQTPSYSPGELTATRSTQFTEEDTPSYSPGQFSSEFTEYTEEEPRTSTQDPSRQHGKYLP